MPVFESVPKLLEEVESDVRDALGQAFPGRFDLVAPFGDFLPIEDANANVTVVPWIWRGRHEETFFEARPTGNLVEVTGVTMVTQKGSEILYHRIVDWQTLYRQIGFLMVCRRPRSPETEEFDTIDIPGTAS
jgi:hypothetical protein